MKNESIRTFICLDLPPEIKERLSSVISRLKDDRNRIKWVLPDQLHITLKFLGNTEMGLVPRIGEILEEISRMRDVFRIVVKKLGSFPPGKRMRVIWAGVEEGRARIIGIWRELETRLSRLGFAEERREYIPHITLGRVRYLSDPSSFISKIKRYEDEVFGECEIMTITLMKSTLLPSGPVYEPVIRKKLGGTGERRDG